MGWSYCGTNPTTGEEMGYSIEDQPCHYPGCTEKIDHGLSYVCGGMHEGGAHGCGYYFCGHHLEGHWIDDDHPCDESSCQLCEECVKRNKEYDEKEKSNHR